MSEREREKAIERERKKEIGSERERGNIKFENHGKILSLREKNYHLLLL